MWKVESATPEDFPAWMELVERVKENFPGLEKAEMMDEYGMTVRRNIQRTTALCVKDEGSVLGLLLFSTVQKRVGCIAVDPDHRRQGIGRLLLESMLSRFARGDEICVTTFRENDEKGKAPRALYTALGFKPCEYCMEHDYPSQVFRLSIAG